MQYWIAGAVVAVPVLLLLGCLPPAPPAVPGKRESQTAVAGMPIAVEKVEELGIYLSGEKEVHKPQADEIVEITGLLLGILPELNLQAMCLFRDADVARMREEGDSLELVFAQPVDMTITQRIEENDRDHIPTDERGYRVLRLKRALFVLGGEMAGHVLIRGEGQDWGCWAIEREGEIDARWIEAVEEVLEE